MPAATLVRSSAELAQQRAAATDALASRWPQKRVEGRAFIDTQDWVEGRRDKAPVSGDPLVGAGRERARAIDAEDDALREGREEAAWYAGFVVVVLGWLRDPSYPETPFMG